MLIYFLHLLKILTKNSRCYGINTRCNRTREIRQYEEKNLSQMYLNELKTPITSIMGYADTLLEGEYDKDTQDMIFKCNSFRS